MSEAAACIFREYEILLAEKLYTRVVVAASKKARELIYYIGGNPFPLKGQDLGASFIVLQCIAPAPLIEECLVHFSKYEFR